MAGRPSVVNIQVVRTCNLRCTFCSHHVWVNPEGMMDFGLYARVLDRVREASIPAIAFVSAQGESLLHPRIFDMIEAATGLQAHLCTNGTPLNEHRIDWLASAKLASIQVSFCGYDKDSYERAYVGARFEQVSRNLAMLIAALRNTETVLSINGVADCGEGAVAWFIQRTREYLTSLGARPDQIRLRAPHNWGGTIGDKRHGPPAGVCPLLVSTPGVYIDGRVTACGCLDANGALEIGNVESEGLMAMRDGPRYRAMVAAFEAGDISSLPLCRDCEIARRPDLVQ